MAECGQRKDSRSGVRWTGAQNRHGEDGFCQGGSRQAGKPHCLSHWMPRNGIKVRVRQSPGQGDDEMREAKGLKDLRNVIPVHPSTPSLSSVPPLM